MLIVQPRKASFGSSIWADVASVAIERKAAKSFFEFGDEGSHVVLADVPEQRVEITVVQELLEDDMAAPVPGEAGLLEFETARNGSEAGRTRISLTGVVMNVRYSVSRKSGSMRTIDLVATSSDGVVDPVSLTEL